MARKHHAKIHATSHQNGGDDEISLSGLSGQQIFIPKNDFIVEVTHADTDKHTVDLAIPLGETRKIISIIVVCYRLSGTGSIVLYANEGTAFAMWVFPNGVREVALKDATQRLQYRLEVANDVWWFYTLGYTVET